jgi:cytochrome c oxidase subunit 2
LDVRLRTGTTFAIVVAAISLLAAGSFASHRWWMPGVAAQHASLLDTQIKWTLIDSGIAFLIAQFALAMFCWTSQEKRLNQAKTFPNGVRVALITSIVFISVELFSAATVGRRAWASLYPAAPSGEVLKVQAAGQQFAFYFRYSGADGKFGPVHVEKIDASVGNYFGLDPANDPVAKDDIVTATLLLPVNQPVELLLSSQDVIHSFYVRELRIQQDMVPGMQIPVHFTPTKIGKYEIVCSQLCGLGHYRMHAYLEVISESDFQHWIQSHQD